MTAPTDFRSGLMAAMNGSVSSNLRPRMAVMALCHTMTAIAQQNRHMAVHSHMNPLRGSVTAGISAATKAIRYSHHPIAPSRRGRRWINRRVNRRCTLRSRSARRVLLPGTVTTDSSLSSTAVLARVATWLTNISSSP